MLIPWNAFWFIIGVSLLVTIHEFGHFWVARKLGFKVLRFSVGFGKPLYKKIGAAPDHIEYVIAAIPLGGYVRMLDERDGKVDAADVLPDGRRFQDIDEFKQLLLADKDQLARGLTEKLLTYATGAAPTTGDRAEIAEIVHNIADKDYGFRLLVHEIVQSKAFQSK